MNINREVHGVDHAPRPRPLGLIAALAALVILAVAAWFTLRRAADDRRDTTRPPARAAMPAMADTAGVSVGGARSVRLSPAELRQFGITLGVAEMHAVTQTVRTAGVVTFDETKLTQVAPRFSGYIERLFVSATGQAVARGAPIATIYSPEVLATEQDLLTAARLEHAAGGANVPGVTADASGLLAATRRRLRLWEISEPQIEEVLRSGKVARTVTLFSPVTGVVIERKAERGQALQAGQTLLSLGDLSDVWINAELREGDAGSVRVGSPADIQFAALKDRTYKGRVSYILPTVAPDARTVTARIVVANADGRLRPGMYATVRLSAPGRRTLTVPSSAVIETGERTIVFVRAGGGELVPTDIRKGEVAGDLTEILAGLTPGQQVVTSAQFLLESESNLGEVMKSMLGMGAGMGAASAGGDRSGGDMKGMAMPDSPPNATDKGADMRNMPGMQMPAPRPR
ncbi:MAG: hypothetical protein NVS1B4_24030 [Gemmatimonadaceae bacterium]